MKKILVIFAIITLAAASCTKSNDIVTPEQSDADKTGKVITVTASIGEPIARLALAENTETNKVEVRWREGDKIYLYGVQGTELVTMDAATVANISGGGRTADFDVTIAPGFNGDLIGSMAPLLHTGEGTLETAIYDCPVPLSELREIPRYFQVQGVTAMNAAEKLTSVRFIDPGMLLLLNVKNTHASMPMLREFDIEENWGAPHVLRTGLQPGPDMQEFVGIPTTINPGEEKTLAVWRASSPGKSAAGVAKYMAVTLDLTETPIPGDFRTTDAAVLLKTRTASLESGKAYELPAIEWDGFHLANAGANYMEFVYVAGGTFSMGAAPNTHEVKLAHFYIGKTEVTQAQWKALMGTDNNPSAHGGNDNLPVENLSWNEINAAGGFMEKLNAIATHIQPFVGRVAGLPTEAQWEYAARGGHYIVAGGNPLFSGGNDIHSQAWFKWNSGNTTHAVGGKNPNVLCTHDMSGNVWEWCADWHGDYPVAAQNDPAGPASGTERVIRGGSFNNEDYGCTVSNRTSWLPADKGGNIGFRVVVAAPKTVDSGNGNVPDFVGSDF